MHPLRLLQAAAGTFCLEKWHVDATYGPPADALTYPELTASKGAAIYLVECIPNGILDENGNCYMGCVIYTLIPQEDGTVFFSVEIQPEVTVPQQDSYQLSLYISTEDVDLNGNPIEGTHRSQDWIVTLTPDPAK